MDTTNNKDTEHNLHEEHEELFAESGDLSIRDYFAAQALRGVMDLMEDESEGEDFGSFAFMAARRAYALADAMLIARDLEFEDDEEEEEEEEEEEGEEEESDDEK